MYGDSTIPTPHYSEAVDCAYKIVDVVNAYKSAVGLPLTPVENPERLAGIVNGVLKFWDNPNISSRENHINWYQQMVEDGWVWDTVLDEVNRKHPALVIDYDEIPTLYKVNDQIFMAIANHFIPQSQ